MDTEKSFTYEFGFIGCGNMGGAICSVIASAHPDSPVAVCDLDERKAAAQAGKNANVSVAAAREIIAGSRFVFLGLKPQILPSFLVENVDPTGDYDCTFVSMAAGVSTSAIEEIVGGVSLIRIMPNIPVSVGEGVVLFCRGGRVHPGEAERFAEAMSCAGLVREIEENKIDAASAVSGCGPAFVYMFIEALADGGVSCGLPRDRAIEYAAQTVLGAAKHALVSGAHPDELKDRVCSPGGSTIEGVLALEQSSFRFACADAVRAAYEKTFDLGKSK